MGSDKIRNRDRNCAAFNVRVAEGFSFQHCSHAGTERKSLAWRRGGERIQEHCDALIIHTDATDHTCLSHHHEIRFILAVNVYDDQAVSQDRTVIPVLGSYNTSPFCCRSHQAESRALPCTFTLILRIHDLRTCVESSDVQKIHSRAVSNPLHFFHIVRLKFTSQCQEML